MSKDGRRSSPRKPLIGIANVKNADGSKKCSLHIRTHCLAIRVHFDEGDGHGNPKPSASTSKRVLPCTRQTGDAILNNEGEKRARATREVIVAGNVFDTPQTLKLSGVSPRSELEKFKNSSRL